MADLASSSLALRVKLLTDDAVAPKKQTVQSAGYDVSASESVTIEAGRRALVSTGVCVATPVGTYAQLAPRSSLAVRSIDVGAGVVDADYRGEVKVLLINNSSSAFVVTKGARIAQMILVRIEHAAVQIAEDLDATARGEGGFGSTGSHVTQP